MLRRLNRDLTQVEVVAELKQRFGRAISQSYLSQIENGSRRHLTNATRLFLAKFFKVHPGYLVERFHTELLSDVAVSEDQLDAWLSAGAERFARDADVSRSLRAVARHADSRSCLVLLEAILDTPGLADRLLQVLRSDRREESRTVAPQRGRR